MDDKGVDLRSRREVLKGAARYVTLGVLAVGLGAMATRPADAGCKESTTCGGCPKFGGCGLEPAKQARENRK